MKQKSCLLLTLMMIETVMMVEMLKTSVIVIVIVKEEEEDQNLNPLMVCNSQVGGVEREDEGDGVSSTLH